MAQESEEKFFWRKDFRDDSEPLANDESEIYSYDPLDRSQVAASLVRRSTKSEPIQQTKVIIGIPAHNSEATLAKTVVALRALNAEIIVVDDLSTDATEEIARQLGCKAIKHPRELGFSDCITSLFLAARRLHATELLTVDVGMEFTVRDAIHLLEQVQNNSCDIAIGSENPIEGTIEAIRDTYSLFRAYGKRALALITPAGTTSVVMEYDVLNFAKQQGLKVRELQISSTGSHTDSHPSWVSKVKAVPQRIERSLNRTLTAFALSHPLLFLGTPAIAMLAAAGIQMVEGFQFWSATGIKPDIAFYYAGFDLVVALVLGVGALILESLNRSRNRFQLR